MTAGTRNFALQSDKSMSDIVSMSSITGVYYDSSGANQLDPSDNTNAELNMYSSSPDLSNDLGFFRNDPDWRKIMTKVFPAVDIGTGGHLHVNNGHNSNRHFAGYFILANELQCSAIE